MSAVDSGRDTSSADLLAEIMQHILSNRSGKTAGNNFTVTSILPISDGIDLADTSTATVKTKGDYEVVDNTPYLIAYLPMNYDVMDASNSNHGTVTGTETYVDHSPEISSTHPLRKAFDFNGSSYITLANESNFDFDRTNPFTLSFWTKYSGNAVELIADKGPNTGPGYTIRTQTDGNLRFILRSTVGNEIRVHTSSPTNDNNWHNIVMSYDGSSTAAGLSIYVDGNLVPKVVDSDTLTVSILNNDPLVIGKLSTDTNYFTGSIDEIQIWNVELSSTDVTDLYAGKQINKSPVTKPAILGLSDVT